LFELNQTICRFDRITNQTTSLMLCYVLVVDVSDNGKLYYYRGYFNFSRPINLSFPENSNEFDEAMKCTDQETANRICEAINKMETPFKYHVEEHMY
jgi:hypothetical protein